MATSELQGNSIAPYYLIGGERVVTAIVERFYDLMDSETRYSELRAMHSDDLSPMRKSLNSFLMGWMGGPRDWWDKNPGKCMMSIHRNFKIGELEAKQWVDAMGLAIDENNLPDDMALSLKDAFARMAKGMQNA